MSDPNDEAPVSRTARPTAPAPLPKGPLVVMTLAAILCVATLGWAGFQRYQRPATLPRYGSVPIFERIDEHDRPVSDRTLRGTVWIADFIFLSCKTSCPKLTEKMSTLQDTLASAAQSTPTKLPIHLVSFSVDPENDTPPKLLEYAQKHRARDAEWSFLTGPAGALESIVVKGFKIQLDREGAKPSEPPGVYTIMHGDWFVLVDSEGVLRGYYDTTDPARVTALVDDARRLAGAR
jgi:protein SCO1/2